MNEDLQNFSQEELEELYQALRKDIQDLELSDDMVCSSVSSNNARYEFLRRQSVDVSRALRELSNSA